ncbi:MAG: ceramidase domain-containing protein [Candidatus Marinimicrobia bacterium]|nr:ceramidase domain-containing protein [Candidatus Neomarinimicrobiota bacterium]
MIKLKELDEQKKLIILISLFAVSLVAMMLFGKIEQPQSYHNFADNRTFFGVPNFFDTVSNLLFFFVGMTGAWFVYKNVRREARYSWLTLFAGVTLVSFGSGYYHWNPNDTTLVWDRLPLNMGFMGLFSAVLTEFIQPKLEKYILVPAVLLGALSVIYWHFVDDLRFYFWLQVVTLLAITAVLFMYEGRFTLRRYLLYVLGLYTFSKFAEFSDRTIYSATNNLLSGHTLKHILAALAVFSVYLMLRRREPREG